MKLFVILQPDYSVDAVIGNETVVLCVNLSMTELIKYLAHRGSE